MPGQPEMLGQSVDRRQSTSVLVQEENIVTVEACVENGTTEEHAPSWIRNKSHPETCEGNLFLMTKPIVTALV